PLVGDVAQAYGERFFARHFDGAETGTSLLVLDPQLTVPRIGESDTPDLILRRQGDASVLEREFTQQARRAIRRHLWPKLIAEPGQLNPPMPLELHVHDREVRLVHDREGALEAWGAGLNAIRSYARGEVGQVMAPSG